LPAVDGSTAERLGPPRGSEASLRHVKRVRNLNATYLRIMSVPGMQIRTNGQTSIIGSALSTACFGGKALRSMKNLALVLAVATGLTGCASSSETGPSDGKGQTTAMDINRALQLAMDKCLPAAELQTVSAADLKQYGFKDSFLAGKNTVVVAVGPKVIIGFFPRQRYMVFTINHKHIFGENKGCKIELIDGSDFIGDVMIAILGNFTKESYGIKTVSRGLFEMTKGSTTINVSLTIIYETGNSILEVTVWRKETSR